MLEAAGGTTSAKATAVKGRQALGGNRKRRRG